MNFWNAIKRIFNFFSKPENRQLIWFLIIAILVVLLFSMKSCNNRLKQELYIQKGEIQRIKNNYEAQQDSVRHYKLNDSTFRAERLAFVLTLDELNKNYKDLLVGFEDFKKNPPKVIINQPILIKETIKEVPVTATINPDGTGEFRFNFENTYADGNYRKIKGQIPYSSRFYSKGDSLFVDYKDLPYTLSLNPGLANFELEQKIKLKIGLFEDPKTKKVRVAVNTSYPGVTFEGLEAYDIMDEALIKAQNKGGKRTFGIGLNIGYGATYSLSQNNIIFGPQLGIGFHYTPKWLQWGK